MVSKLISRNPWTIVGGMDWFSTPIDEMKHGQSYLDLPKSFWAFQFFPSHCNKQFFRCYRPSKTKSNFFVHSTHHKFYYGNFDYLGLDFRLKIRKLWLKRWFCTVCQEYVFLCVTWQTKEVLVQNWLLKMLKLFLNVISICHEGPRKSITTTSEVCFKANSHNTVWNVTHN